MNDSCIVGVYLGMGTWSMI